MASRDLKEALNRYTCNNVQIKKARKKEALNVWEEAVRRIIANVSRRDSRFEIQNVLSGGSFYERLKVKEPNEFDLMLEMKKLELDDQPYEEEDHLGVEPPVGYTTIMIDQGEERDWQRDTCIDMRRKLLNAVQVKSVFGRHVSAAIAELGYGRNIQVSSHGPAVTLKVTNLSSGKEYSIDLVLAVKDKSWPEDADEWKTRKRNGWPSPQLVSQVWHQGCHLVAKQPKPAFYSGPEDERKLLWLYSFSRAERTLLREGAQGQASSCRKQVIRILKALREDLNMTQLKSYHLKTIVLYECERYPHPSQWAHDKLQDRFQTALTRLHSCLMQRNCPHYFIKNLNLFERFQNCEALLHTVRRLVNDPQQMIERVLQRST